MTTSKKLLLYSRITKRKRFIFLKLVISLIFRKSKQPQAKIFQEQSNLSYRIDEVLLSVFIDCLIDKDYKGLVKHGTATEIDILQAWESVFNEYVEKSGTKNYFRILSLYRIIGKNNCKLLQIKSYLYILRQRHNGNCIKNLKDLGYKFEYSDESIESDLNKIESNIKTIMIENLKKEKELSELQSEYKGKEIDKDYFTNQLMILWKWKGGEIIRSNNITVSEYLALLNLYIKEQK